MAITDQLTALANDKNAIRNAILAKGGICPETHGFDNFAADILDFPDVYFTLWTPDSDTAQLELTGLPFRPDSFMVCSQFMDVPQDANLQWVLSLSYNPDTTETYTLLGVFRVAVSESFPNALGLKVKTALNVSDYVTISDNSLSISFASEQTKTVRFKGNQIYMVGIFGAD